MMSDDDDYDAEHRSQKIGFDEKGQLRFIEQDIPKMEFKEIDLHTLCERHIRKVNITMPDGTIVPGILPPRRLGDAAMEASGFQIAGGVSMQSGTGTGREGAPSVGGMHPQEHQQQQQQQPKKPRNILQEMRQRYPAYFQSRPIPSTNIREAIDPYSFSIRNQFINAARTDPTLAPALRKRKNAFFRNGFTLELQTTDTRSTVTNRTMTDEELEKFHVGLYKKYHTVLRILETWANNTTIDLLAQMKKAYYSAVVQGRYLCRFFPPLSFLEPHVLPFILETLSTEELHNVVIDKFTKQIVACRIASIDNDRHILLPDEFVYGYINDDTMTKYETLYGRTDLEPVIQASRTNKFIVAEAYPKAAVAAYLPKIVGQIAVDGSEEEKEAILKSRSALLGDPELTVLLSEASEFSKLEALPQNVNHDMIRNIRNDIDEIMIGAVGSTKAQISRTENLTRDNATIQEIENERNVITPDELTHAKFFETQLLNPLFAHLCGVPEEYLDAKIVICRIPDKEDILEKINMSGEKKGGEGGAQDPEGRQQGMEEEKKEDIASGALQQQDAKTALGASAEASGDYLSWFIHLPKKHQVRWRQFDSVATRIVDLSPLTSLKQSLPKITAKESFDEHKDDDGNKWEEFIGKMLDKLTKLATAPPPPPPQKQDDQPDGPILMTPAAAAAIHQFDESKRNRDNDGKFANKGGGQKAGGEESDGATPADDPEPAAKQYERVVAMVSAALKNNKDKEGFSINPQTGNIYDATNPKEAKKMYEELVKTNNFDASKPIQIVGITNHEGRLGRRVHSAYSEIAGVSPTPLFGFWRSSDTGFSYLDVSYPVQMADADAKALGTHHAQESILSIDHNGEATFL